jgi:hypothetical protein
MGSALLIRAEQTEQTDTSEAKPDLDLKSDKATVCSGTPDFAKGVTTGPSPVIAIPPIDVSGFEKDRRSAVLSLIRYPWQDLGYDIIFMGARPGYRAMTLTAKRRIEIYVRQGEGDRSIHLLDDCRRRMQRFHRRNRAGSAHVAIIPSAMLRDP